jgi:alpha-glucosidase
VDRQEADKHSVLHHYRAMLAFRRRHSALVKGSIKTLDAPEDVLAFVRQDGTERLYCVFNMSPKAAIVPIPEGFSLAESGAPGIVAEPVNDALSLAPFGAYIGVLH